MSFVSDNPERYDDIIRKGILNFIEKRMASNGFEVPGEWREGYEAFVETLQADPTLHKLYDTMMDMSTKEILNAEQDYFGRLFDQAKGRFDAN